jgi:hypothetical protein
MLRSIFREPIKFQVHVRTKTPQFQNINIPLAVNEHHVRFYVTVAVPFPFTLHCMVNRELVRAHPLLISFETAASANQLELQQGKNSRSGDLGQPG